MNKLFQSLTYLVKTHKLSCKRALSHKSHLGLRSMGVAGFQFWTTWSLRP